MIKKRVFIGLISGSLVLSAGFMEDMASQVGSMLGSNQAQKQTPSQPKTSSQTQLVSQLTQMLNVNPKQAVGGTAALMALAFSKMPKDSYDSIVSSIPGLSSILSNSGAMGSIASAVGGVMGQKNTVDSAFKALGMDSSAVSQFAPALLEIFKQYVSSDKLNLLSQAWSAFLPKK